MYSFLTKLMNLFDKDLFPESLNENTFANKKDFYGFNNQFIRASIIVKLLKNLPVDCFIETGTCSGHTSFLINC